MRLRSCLLCRGDNEDREGVGAVLMATGNSELELELLRMAAGRLGTLLKWFSLQWPLDREECSSKSLG